MSQLFTKQIIETLQRNNFFPECSGLFKKFVFQLANFINFASNRLNYLDNFRCKYLFGGFFKWENFPSNTLRQKWRHTETHGHKQIYMDTQRNTWTHKETH